MSLFYWTILAVTTLLWGIVFYKKDYHPQPKRIVVKSFVAGMFSMIPVFTYKHLYETLLPMLAEHRIFRPLLDSPLLIGFTAFLTNLVALALILFAMSGIVSVVLNFYNHNLLANLKSALKEEPMGFTAVSLLIGIVIAVEAFLQKTFSIPVLGTMTGAILFLAIIEEYVKHLMVRIGDDKKLKDIDDAITLSVVVGLAFAFVETLFYAIVVGDIRLIFYRSMISIPIHLVASGIFGYFYGLSHFAKPIVGMDGGEKIYGKRWLPKVLTLKRSVLYKEEKIIEGFLFATLFHAAMNLLFEAGIGYLGVPLVTGGIWLVFRLYRISKKESRLISLFMQSRKKQLALLKNNG